MFFLLIEGGHFVYVVYFAIHPYADIAVLAYLLKELCMLTLFGAHGGSDYLYPSLPKGHYPIHHNIYTLPLYGQTALGAVRMARPCVQKPEIIVYFGYSAHGGAGII